MPRHKDRVVSVAKQVIHSLWPFSFLLDLYQTANERLSGSSLGALCCNSLSWKYALCPNLGTGIAFINQVTEIKIMAAGKPTATEHPVIRFNTRSILPALLSIAQHTEQQHENGIHKFRSQAVKSGLNLRLWGQDTTICDSTSDFSNQQQTEKELTHDKRSSGQSGPVAPSALEAECFQDLVSPVKYDCRGIQGDLTKAPAHM